jgi:TonB family protein
MVEARAPLAGLLTSWGRASARSGIGLPLSIALHALGIALIVAISLVGPDAQPELMRPPVLRIPLGLPLAAAAPLPLGSENALRRRSQPTVPDEDARPQPVVAPDVLVQPVEAPLQPEAGAPESLQAGIPDGRPNGIEEGDRRGRDGGVAGGDPNGIPGGVPWGTGFEPVKDYDRGPRLVVQTRPMYPQAAFVQKIEGEVLLELLIDDTGRVARARVLQSIPQLDAAALRCVEAWRFEPARRAGRAVAVIAHAPVSFRIY